MPNVRCVPVGALETNCYIVWLDGRNDCLLIDPGAEAERILDLTIAMQKKVAAVLLTHGHFDHISAVDAITADGTAVYIHEDDREMLADTHLNVSDTCETEVICSAMAVPVREGDVLSLAGMQVSVLHTPGHTAGSACFQIDDCMFTGDTLFVGGYGRTDMPTGSFSDLRKSVYRMYRLCEKMRMYPGHGAVKE